MRGQGGRPPCPRIESMGMITYRTGFTVEHGFRFHNWFVFDVRLSAGLSLGRVEPGLCGGMAYAALDYYHAGIPVPRMRHAPAQGSPLSRYLIQRQLASNSPAALYRVLRWTTGSIAALEHRMLTQELPALRQRLQRNEPTVLVLVRAPDLSHVTANHQVVACGYHEDEAAGTMRIDVYDPNWPGEAITLSLELAEPDWGLEAWHSREGDFKGLFLQSYAPRRQSLPLIP